MNLRSGARVSPAHSNAFELRLTLGIPAVAEVVLLAVGIPEDEVAGQVDENNQRGKDRTELNLLEDKVTGLERIHEWHPSQVTNGKHEAEPVGGNIHGSEDRGLEGDEREKEINYRS